MKLHQIRDLFRQDPNPEPAPPAKKTPIPEKPKRDSAPPPTRKPCDPDSHKWQALEYTEGDFCGICGTGRMASAKKTPIPEKREPCKPGRHRFDLFAPGHSAGDVCSRCLYTRGELPCLPGEHDWSGYLLMRTDDKCSKCQMARADAIYRERVVGMEPQPSADILTPPPLADIGRPATEPPKRESCGWGRHEWSLEDACDICGMTRAEEDAEALKDYGGGRGGVP